MKISLNEACREASHALGVQANCYLPLIRREQTWDLIQAPSALLILPNVFGFVAVSQQEKRTSRLTLAELYENPERKSFAEYSSGSIGYFNA